MIGKLGKLPAKIDTRTIPFRKITRAMPPPPDIWDNDVMYPGFSDTYMYGNDQWGCCAISARAHQTLRFELKEQGKEILITTNEVLSEYWYEQGSLPTTIKKFCIETLKWESRPDNGLVLLDSLNCWRKQGWKTNKQLYSIYAFSAVDWKDKIDVKNCIYLLDGGIAGFLVPRSSETQFNKGEIWSKVTDDGGIMGGHAIYVVGYNEWGPVCMTWGKKQQMTWEFWNTYVDEFYGIVDNRNNWMGDSSRIDVAVLDNILKAITT